MTVVDLKEALKHKVGSRHPWLMPIILTTQEAEIRRISVHLLEVRFK
jgi:hypothetical protein